MKPSLVKSMALFQIVMGLNLVMPSEGFSAGTAAAKTLPANCIKVRASFDIGSSSTKMRVFKIDACHQKILDQLFPDETNKAQKKLAVVEIGFKKDLDESLMPGKADARYTDDDLPRFSQYLMEITAVKQLQALKDLAAPYNPTDYVGVATEAFRAAKNAKQLLNYIKQEVGINVIPATQDQEAQIEYMGVVGNLVRQKFDIPGSKVVSLGIGAGSTQVGVKRADGNFDFIPSKLASEAMLTRSIKVGNGTDKLLPVSRDQIEAMVSMAKEEILAQAAQFPSVKPAIQAPNMVVFGVGGTINLSVKPFLKCLVGENLSFDKDNLQEALDKIREVSETNDAAFCGIEMKYRAQTVSNLAMVLGYMRGLGIKEIFYSPVDNTFGAPFTVGLQLIAHIHKVVKPTPKPTSQGVVVSAAAPSAAAEAESASAIDNALAPTEDTSRQACNANHGVVDERAHTCTIAGTCVALQNYCTGGDGGLGQPCTITGGKLTLIFPVGVCK